LTTASIIPKVLFCFPNIIYLAGKKETIKKKKITQCKNFGERNDGKLKG